MKRLALVLAVAAALGACSRQEDSASTAASSVTPAPSAPSAPADTTVAANATSTSPAPSSTSPDASNTAALGAAGSGQDTYGKACVVCHGAGVAGAPKLGDKGDWGPRIAQGNDMLYDHAIKGYTGKKGMMPPKGGNTALADADVKAAVDYMVAQGK
jgi:cytochrome c5